MNAKHMTESNQVIVGEMEFERIRIKIIGVGGAGNNAVDRLKLDNLSNVCLAGVNTDGQVLRESPIEEKVMIGGRLTRGLGAGGEMDLGRQAAEEDREKLKSIVDGVDLVFILAGLGGGTGSGSTPVLAEVAVEAGALAIGFVTLPFTIEGARRHKQAEESLVALREVCHAVVTLPNDILLQQVEENATVLEAFALADEWINRGVRSICAMLFETGLINVDFAALQKSFENRGGKTLFGLGHGSGGDYVGKAVNDLMMCPLLQTPEYSRRADSLIVNIIGGPDLTINKVNEIVTIVAEKFGSKENTLIGATIDEGMHESASICVIGTTDIDGRKRYARPGAAHSDFRRSAKVGKPRMNPDSRWEAVHTSKLKGRKMKKSSQEEFDFMSVDVQRGYFDKTERNLYDGEDLDVPTYLRRGVRIKL